MDTRHLIFGQKYAISFKILPSPTGGHMSTLDTFGRVRLTMLHTSILNLTIYRNSTKTPLPVMKILLSWLKRCIFFFKTLPSTIHSSILNSKFFRTKTPIPIIKLLYMTITQNFKLPYSHITLQITIKKQETLNKIIKK